MNLEGHGVRLAPVALALKFSRSSNPRPARLDTAKSGSTCETSKNKSKYNVQKCPGRPQSAIARAALRHDPHRPQSENWRYGDPAQSSWLRPSTRAELTVRCQHLRTSPKSANRRERGDPIARSRRSKWCQPGLPRLTLRGSAAARPSETAGAAARATPGSVATAGRLSLSEMGACTGAELATRS